MKYLIGDDCFRILDSNKYIIFYFTASWCGPCQRILPEIEQINANVNKYIDIFKIDIDEDDNNELCDICNIKSVPSFLLFKDRTCIGRVTGANLSEIEDMINKLNIKK